MTLVQNCHFVPNEAETCTKIDTPLTHEDSPSVPVKKRRRITFKPEYYLSRMTPVLPAELAPRTFTFWRQPDEGFPTGDVVYFIYCAGRMKIGTTTSLSHRIAQIVTHSPFVPVAVLLVRGGRKEEMQFHARFMSDRLHGEWFSLSKKLRDFLKRRLCPIGRASLKAAEVEFAQFN